MNVAVAINGIAAEDNSDSVECRLSVSVYDHVSSCLLFAFDFAFVVCVLPGLKPSAGTHPSVPLPSSDAGVSKVAAKTG